MTEAVSDELRGSLRGTLRTLAMHVELLCKSPATGAALRRGTPTDVAHTAAFHRVLTVAGIEDDSAERLLRWATVVQCMAIGGDSRAPLSDGAMLARVGFSESRFSRLLTAGGSTVQDQCVLASRFLHAREHPCRWDDLGALLVLDSRSGESTERIRLRLARDYFRTLGD